MKRDASVDSVEEKRAEVMEVEAPSYPTKSENKDAAEKLKAMFKAKKRNAPRPAAAPVKAPPTPVLDIEEATESYKQQLKVRISHTAAKTQ